MRKKKIALFYDSDTESGKKILEFLAPFDKRKSDIVGELVLLWINEHGASVPVEWLNRKNGCIGERTGYFGKSSFVGTTINEQEATERRKNIEVTETSTGKEAEQGELDVSLVKAGLSSFF